MFIYSYHKPNIMKRSTKSTETPDHVVMYANLLAKHNLTNGVNLTKWKTVNANKHRYSNTDAYYKAAYLALKADWADWAALNKKQKSTPSLNDLIAEQTKLAQEALIKAEEHRKQTEEYSKTFKECWDRLEEKRRLENQRKELEMYRQPKRPGIIVVACSLLSSNMTHSQLN